MHPSGYARPKQASQLCGTGQKMVQPPRTPDHNLQSNDYFGTQVVATPPPRVFVHARLRPSATSTQMGCCTSEERSVALVVICQPPRDRHRCVGNAAQLQARVCGGCSVSNSPSQMRLASVWRDVTLVKSGGGEGAGALVAMTRQRTRLPVNEGRRIGLPRRQGGSYKKGCGWIGSGL